MVSAYRHAAVEGGPAVAEQDSEQPAGRPAQGTPQYGTPEYGTPQYGTPSSYGTPPTQPYGAPQYGASQYGSSQYGQPPYGTGYEPSQAVLALVLGIVGVFVFQLVAPFAWVIGHRELQAIDAGRRNPNDRGVALAGKILGIVGTVILGLIILFFALAFAGLIAAGLFTATRI